MKRVTSRLVSVIALILWTAVSIDYLFDTNPTGILKSALAFVFGFSILKFVSSIVNDGDPVGHSVIRLACSTGVTAGFALVAFFLLVILLFGEWVYFTTGKWALPLFDEDRTGVLLPIESLLFSNVFAMGFGAVSLRMATQRRLNWHSDRPCRIPLISHRIASRVDWFSLKMLTVTLYLFIITIAVSLSDVLGQFGQSALDTYPDLGLTLALVLTTLTILCNLSFWFLLMPYQTILSARMLFRLIRRR
ncbi:MAG: hypothetical protein ACPGRZ_15670 [Alphaproteobacteria bacterium]